MAPEAESEEPLLGGADVAELRQKLAAFAARAGPRSAALFLGRGFQKLHEELGGDAADADGGERRLVALVVRGADDGRSPWLVEYAGGGDGAAARGRVLSGAAAAAGIAAATARVSRVEVSSYQDVVDVASGRRSAIAAIARRRIVISGDVRGAAGRLAPLLVRALSAAVAELQDVEEEARAEAVERPGLQATCAAWMPNEASDACLVCGLRWQPVIRQRHHCRACGILVCGACSTRRRALVPSGERQCLRCVAGGAPSQPPAWCAASATDSFWSDGAALGGSRVSLLSDARAPLVSDDGGQPCPPKAPAEATPLPPGAASEGVLLAQVKAAMAGRLSERIAASPPSERERRLWRRLLDSEKALKTAVAAAAAGGSGDLWRSLAGLALAAARGPALGLCLAGGAVLAATAAREELPAEAAAYVEASLPRTLLFFTALALAYSAAEAPRALLLCSALRLVCCWRWLAAAEPPALLLLGAAAARPWWALACALALAAAVYVARRAARLVSIYLVAAVPILVYWGCGRAQTLFRLSDAAAQELLYDNADALMAPYLANRFLALQGLFVKLGQWCSNVSYGVPVKLQESLKKLVDDCAEDDEAHVRATILEAFGKPLEDLFEDFDLQPIASASIAQVHRATMVGASGERRTVAVKLQHSSVEPLILLDLGALNRIVSFCVWLGGEKWRDTKRMLDSWSKDMVLELDFAHEVRNLREVREGLAAAGVDVVVPTEVPGLVARRAFVMEFCEGFRFTDVDRLVMHGVDRQAMGARALHATACQLLEIGVFNSDPHAGNLLCQAGAHAAWPVLLDFGNCIRLTQAQRLSYCRLLIALSEASVTKAREALDNVGLRTSQSDTRPERDLEYMMWMFRDTGNSRESKQSRDEFFAMRKQQREADMAELGATTKDEKKKAKKQVARYPNQIPDEFILFIRMMMLVRGLCTQLDVQLPFLSIFEYHARRALISLQPLARRALAWSPPAAADGGRRADGVEALQRGLRGLIAECCAERPGLGVQVCVYIGGACAVDECGGVLGAVDPRPMARGTPVPLGDLSRLPLLLAAAAEAKADRLRYGAAVGPILGGPCAGPTLGEALSFRALRAPEAAGGTFFRGPREILAGTSAADLKNGAAMTARICAALGPVAEPHAYYLPLGAGYAAAAALAAARRGAPDAARLPETPFAGELVWGAASKPASGRADKSPHGPPAALSSALLSDFRKMWSGEGGGPPTAAGGGASPAAGGESPNQAKGHWLGGFSGGGRASPSKSPGAGAGSPRPAGMPGATSILDAARGLLVDPSIGVGSGCPDLGASGSARAVAAALAAAAPARGPLGGVAWERPGEGAVGMAALPEVLGLWRRGWTESGFEVFEAARSGEDPVAVGLSGAAGLLSLALQWRPVGRGEAVTAVVLTNEVSTAMVPSRLLSEVVARLHLPPPAVLES